MFTLLFSMQWKLMVNRCQAPKMTKSTMKDTITLYLKSSESHVIALCEEKVWIFSWEYPPKLSNLMYVHVLMWYVKFDIKDGRFRCVNFYNVIYFHCMKMSSMNILSNIILNLMEEKSLCCQVWWHSSHFWVNYGRKSSKFFFVKNKRPHSCPPAYLKASCSCLLVCACHSWDDEDWLFSTGMTHQKPYCPKPVSVSCEAPETGCISLWN